MEINLDAKPSNKFLNKIFEEIFISTIICIDNKILETIKSKRLIKKDQIDSSSKRMIKSQL